MIIFWIILIWSFVTSIFFSFLSKKIKATDKTKFIFLMITFLAMIFFASHRSVVSDTKAYTNFFNAMPNQLHNISTYISTMKKDTLFWLLSAIFKCLISTNYHVWFAFITLLCSFLLGKFIIKHSEMPFLSGFMFILNCDFCWLFNGMRQFIAVCIMLYAFDCLLENKKIKFFLSSLFAISIHFSAILIVPILIMIKSIKNKKAIILIIFLMLILITRLQTILPKINLLLSDTEYRDVISQFASDDGVNIIRVIISLVPVIMYFILRKNYKESNSDEIKPIVNMCIMNSLVLLLGVFTSGIYIGRFSIYFDIFTLILYPYIFKNLLKTKDKPLILFCYILLYFIYFYYQMVIVWQGFGYVSDSLGINFRW